MNKVVPIAIEAMRQAKSGGRPVRLTGTVDDLVRTLRPAAPLYVIWPERISQESARFRKAFPGEAMYAVKTNPDKSVLQAVYHGGIRSFDAASIEEVRAVRKAFRSARINFMHTVKSPEAIREAYEKHGVRVFSLDTADEMKKILAATDLADDLTLFVRFAPPKNGRAAIDFSAKFGASFEEAAQLLRQCRFVAQRIGLCFHVGTQSTDPAVYGRAVSMAAKIIREGGVPIDVLDIGGGFPVPYPGQEIPALESCIDAMAEALKKEKLDHLPLLAEPGRALVAQGGALITRVELRKGQTLYLNDGTYGGLFDAGPLLNTKFPVRAIRAKGKLSAEMQEYRFAGPTCDSLDMMAGPFILPADIKVGDWIEIGNLGAYSQSMRTNFNGFGQSDTVCLYEQEPAMKASSARGKVNGEK
jgi:ornithine decarboxylase